MPRLMESTAAELSDPSFLSAEMFGWAERCWTIGLENLKTSDPEAASRVTRAIQNGVAHVEVRLDLDGATASFILNIDGGDPLELFASVPLPRSPAR